MFEQIIEKLNSEKIGEVCGYLDFAVDEGLQKAIDILIQEEKTAFIPEELGFKLINKNNSCTEFEKDDYLLNLTYENIWSLKHKNLDYKVNNIKIPNKTFAIELFKNLGL